MQIFKLITRILYGAFYVLAGVMHFVNSDFFLRIMPPYLPFHYAIVLISGVCEIGLGIALMVPKTSRMAGWGLIALLIAVFPANLHMAMHPDLFSEMSPTALYIRLPIQGLLILWAYWYTRPAVATAKIGD